MAYVSELCGSKLRAKLSSEMNESAAAPVFSTFAEKQLQKMGWKEGGGLGKDGSGISTHIRVKKREENIGIGQEKKKVEAAGDTWWSNSLESTLARLHAKNANGSDNKKNKKKRKTPKRPPTDEELFAATGGARFGMRAQRRAEGKWKRTELCPELKRSEENVVMEWNGLGKAKVVSSANVKINDNKQSPAPNESAIVMNNPEIRNQTDFDLNSRREEFEEDNEKVQKKDKKKKSKKGKKNKRKISEADDKKDKKKKRKVR
eukprot:CAMPEP_0194268368 /NCGR_PEP_ID=MMETSP0169-20130528/2714_1 /TAXON_ID=218684 /ORGANISM="Corethron pennatum, Strain L29A3" /LENGTH=260 /DNA_ID=CAMNT_0039009581 /DNA_START=161 /DNA_END=943 /DNA_ORIENTATION=+